MHNSTRWARRLAALLILPLCVSACDSERFLDGRWVLDNPENGLNTQALGCKGSKEECTVYPELILGHFGEEVVGVVRYFDDPKRKDESACDRCGGCQSIEENDFDGETLFFRFKPCEGSHYNQRIDTDGTSVTWKVIDAAGETVQTLEFVKSSRRPTSAEKVCGCEQLR